MVLQRIANESADGRVATTRIQALQQKKAAELNEKQQAARRLQQKLEKEGSVMSASASGDLQKQIEKLTLEVQRFTQDAQAEVQELQQELQAGVPAAPRAGAVAGRHRDGPAVRVQRSRRRPGVGGLRARHLDRSHQEARLGQARPASRQRTRDEAARSVTAGSAEVLDRLAHRFPSLLVDTVDEHEPGKRLVAIKNVTVNEDFFQGHFPDKPLMPAVLMIEALTQAATLLIAGSSVGRDVACSCAASTAPSSAGTSSPAID